MASTQHLQIDIIANGQPATEADVDKWELKAGRRALRNIKTLLYQQPMLDLIMPQIEAGDAYFKEIIARSHGRYRECRTDLKVSGLSLKQVMQLRKTTLALPRKDMALLRLLPIHPEHYVIPPYDGEGMVEVIGEHMARLRLITTDKVPAWVLDYADPAYTFKKSTVAELDDGSVISYILHEFRDAEYGCDLRLRLLFPAAAPQVFFDEHAEHLAIEFTNGLRMAFEDVRLQPAADEYSTADTLKAVGATMVS